MDGVGLIEAAINQGNSGGPVVNEQNEVVCFSLSLSLCLCVWMDG
jgi:S1-C subfamily serine protease